MSLLRGCCISVITVDFPGLQPGQCFQAPPLYKQVVWTNAKLTSLLINNKKKTFRGNTLLNKSYTFSRLSGGRNRSNCSFNDDFKLENDQVKELLS